MKWNGLVIKFQSSSLRNLEPYGYGFVVVMVVMVVDGGGDCDVYSCGDDGSVVVGMSAVIRYRCDDSWSARTLPHALPPQSHLSYMISFVLKLFTFEII